MGLVSTGTGETEVTNIITGKPVREPLFYESITKIHDPASGATVRVWRAEEELPEWADTEILGIFKCIPQGVDMKEMMQILGSLERVTAVEMTDKNGLGAVVYYEW